MRVAILSSGGKDSTYAHWWANLQGWNVISLITCKIIEDDSMMFQIPCVDIVETQSIVTNTKYIEFEISGDEKSEIEELKKGILENMHEGEILFGIDALISGAIKSDYQKTRIERMCEDLNIHSFSPLWHNNSKAHMKDLISQGFKIIITSVSCDGLGEEWLGRTLDIDNYPQLEEIAQKYRFNIDGEGGEFETSVINAPHFISEISVEFEKRWRNNRGYLTFTNINI